MRRALVSIIGATLVLSLAVSAPAGAAQAGKPKFCATLEQLDAKLQATTGADAAGVAGQVAKALRKAVKKAPKSLRKSLKVLAGAYEHVAGGGTIDELIVDQGDAFNEASAKYALYYTEKCLGVQLPSTVPAG